ncbi:MAG: cell wall hydrolase [bacterium]
MTKRRRGALHDPAYHAVVLLAQDVLAGRTPRMTTPTHYHADYITPYWAASLPKLGRIGNHIFYAER